jgi:pyruvate kinase
MQTHSRRGFSNALDILIDESSRSVQQCSHKQLGRWPREVHRAHRASAVNLAHYFALRKVDLRRIQERLAWLGVSSLGRSETHVLANPNKVLGILNMLAGRQWMPETGKETGGYERGRALLYRNADALFGGEPAGRSVRIMVTLPSEAASDHSPDPPQILIFRRRPRIRRRRCVRRPGARSSRRSPLVVPADASLGYDVTPPAAAGVAPAGTALPVALGPYCRRTRSPATIGCVGAVP